ncbi:F0F1 ATP synthase subunit delta [Candidatus Methylospira mobilis]|nr:F0F1 ATP synthase subunit delta [Candidatus Methylospira mobilis]
MMQFDWTTFILEILNFLVLMWILRHFLYRPVLALLDERRRRIGEERLAAEQMRNEAETLLKQYQSRLAEWELERESSRRHLEEQLNQARTEGLAKLEKSLADEATRLRARNDALNAAGKAIVTREAAITAYSQTAALLQRLASPQLTLAIVGLFLEDLAALPAEEHDALQRAASSLSTDAEISSAHALDAMQRAAVSQALAATAGRKLNIVFRENPALIAGLCAVIGECRLDANIAAELAFFRRCAGHV